MVVAGKRISNDIVDQVMLSAIMKDSSARCCLDKGALNEVEVQRCLERYLLRSVLDMLAGRSFVESAWSWLHGR